MAHLVPESCTKVVYDEWVYLFPISPEFTAEMLVNFINESLIPEIEAISAASFEEPNQEYTIIG